jgi:hypothetical protein
MVFRKHFIQYVQDVVKHLVGNSVYHQQNMLVQFIAVYLISQLMLSKTMPTTEAYISV